MSLWCMVGHGGAWWGMVRWDDGGTLWGMVGHGGIMVGHGMSWWDDGGA